MEIDGQNAGGHSDESEVSRFVKSLDFFLRHEEIRENLERSKVRMTLTMREFQECTDPDKLPEMRDRVLDAFKKMTDARIENLRLIQELRREII
jgi:flagellar basal body-associated protein FliL